MHHLLGYAAFRATVEQYIVDQRGISLRVNRKRRTDVSVQIRSERGRSAASWEPSHVTVEKRTMGDHLLYGVFA